MRVSPSILAADPESDSSFSKAIDLAEKLGATYLHIDVMDGVFVENTTLWNNPSTIAKLSTHLPLDIHIMIDNPDQRAKEFLAVKPKILTFHPEVSQSPESTIDLIKSTGTRPGLAINPELHISSIAHLLPLVDHVLLMTIHPGAAGKTFMPEQLKKIQEIKTINPNIELEVDGGINDITVHKAKEADADVVVSSSYIYKAENPKDAFQLLLDA